MELELKLLNALKDDGKEKDDGVKKLRITKGAFAKAKLYAKLVSRIAGDGMECYSYLLKRKDSFDDLIRDVYFADDQDTTAAHVRVTPEGVKKAGDMAAQRNCEILGWTHSHGSMDTFHSQWDRDNFETLLHSIAPQTMYKKEEAVFLMKDNMLNVDNYRIEGVMPADGRIRIVKKVERDPFAFSIVVNDHDQHYLECITKTYDSITKKFNLNQPFHPKLKPVDVDDDVALDIPDMEWDIREKIHMDRESYGEADEPAKQYDCKKYNLIAAKFFSAAHSYIKSGGEYSAFIKDMLKAEAAVSRYELLRKCAKGAADGEPDSSNEENKNTIENLEACIKKGEFKKYLDPNTKFKKFELENLILLQLMVSFYKKGESANDGQLVKKQDRLIEAYKNRAQTLGECVNVAEAAVKSLTRYAMGELTDYKHAHNHKYRRLMSNILANVSTGKNYPLLDSIKKESAKKPTYGIKKQIFLHEDRLNIFNQLVKDIYYMKIGKCNSSFNSNTCMFLSEFADAYVRQPEKLDEIIEKYVLPVRLQQEQFKNYNDQSLAEHEKEEKQKEERILMRLREERPKRAKMLPYAKEDSLSVELQEPFRISYDEAPYEKEEPELHPVLNYVISLIPFFKFGGRRR